MSGEQVKQKLIQGGVKISDLHTLLETSPQNVSRGLSVADVKTGFLEKLCSVLNVDMSFFYEGTEYLPTSSPPTGTQMVPKFLYDELKQEQKDEKERMQNEIYEYRDTINDLKNQIKLMQAGLTIPEIAQKEVV